MDKELFDILVNLKIDSKALQTLIDTILDNCRLGYDDKSLVINNDEAVFSIIKAFRPDEYNNRFAALKAEREKLKAEEA
jgi:hypothetical protein